MDLMHPAVLTALILLLGGAGLLLSADRKRGSATLAFVTCAVAAAVWIVSVRFAPPVTDPGDWLLDGRDAVAFQLTALLLLAIPICLALPDRLAAEHPTRAAAFLLPAAGAILAMSAADAYWLQFLLGECGILALSYASRSSEEKLTRRDVRSLGASVMLACGFLAIGLATRRFRFTTLEALLQNAAFDPEHFVIPVAQRLGLKCGLILILTGLAWRLNFFPFPPDPGAHDSQPLKLCELLTSSIVLFRLLPALRGLEHFSQTLLFTFAVVSLIRFAGAAGRHIHLEEVFGQLLMASAALVWISLTIPLFDRTHAVAAQGWINGSAAGLRELVSAVLSWLVLTGALRISERRHRPILRRDDLQGLLNTSPILGLLFAVGLLNWIGFPPLTGFYARFGLLSGLFQLTAAGTTASGAYAMLALLVLAVIFWIAAVALWQLQPVASPLPLRRIPIRIPFWNSLPVLLAVAAIGWLGVGSGMPVPDQPPSASRISEPSSRVPAGSLRRTSSASSANVGRISTVNDSSNETDPPRSHSFHIR